MTDRTRAVDAWESLYRAQVSILRRLLAVFPEGLSFNEYDVLFNLYRQPQHAARIRDLTKHLLLTQPSVSRLIDRIEARGLVTRSRDAHDARGTVITLSDLGLELFRRVGAQHSTAIAHEMSVLAPEEIDELLRLTQKLRGPDAGPRLE
ncbi:MarR family winged helix-turn-helix transcriptional regulator [uncultured Schumannella sp.]|uniref:MarR family winged helix-turn-helix transcriptional regulator n=1 Tax=uncultured Schumannella sp. TaxID=1195956 RepID=UPI0025CCFA6C|nr:MarR family winged helix-turn-helix transcriptional regulator [uncultured Schumannella sp.]